MLFTKLREEIYRVEFDNGSLAGEIMMDSDGFFYFWPRSGPGFWTGHHLMQIARKLDALNESHKQKLDKFFNENNPNS